MLPDLSEFLQEQRSHPTNEDELKNAQIAVEISENHHTEQEQESHISDL